MSNLSSILKCRCSLYAMQDVDNDLGELMHVPVLQRRVWCRITPRNGREINGVAEMSDSEITHEVVMRKKSAVGLSREMYLEYCGQRLDISYVMPHYREPDRVVVYCVGRGIR